MNYRVVNDRYELRRVIGTGAYSIVWEAWDRHLNRVDAMKFARPLPAEDHVRPEILEEARRQGRIRDEGVVTVYDVEHEEAATKDANGGGPFIVMEYVAGQSLKQRLAELAGHPMPVTEAMAVAGGVLEALEAAHAADIRHGDIKPSNILLREDGVVKVCDFGAARSLESLSDASAVGAWFGTAQYQDPDLTETQLPRRENDLYSMCLVIYEMLAEGFLHDLQQTHSLPDLATLNHSVPAGISKIVMAQLRPRLSQRPPHCRTASGLRTALMRAVSEEDAPTVATASPIETRPFTVVGPTTARPAGRKVGSASPALNPVHIDRRSIEPEPREGAPAGVQGRIRRILSRFIPTASELSPLAEAISEYYWRSAEMTSSLRYLQVPSELTVAVPGSDPSAWSAAIISADRDACRAVRARVNKELGPEWDLILPDLHLEVVQTRGIAQPQLVAPGAGLQGDGARSRVSVDETFRNALVLRVMSRPARGAFAIDAETVVFPGLRFGTGRTCMPRYRGPGQARLDVQALQIISCEDRQVVCQVLDRRGMLLQRGRKEPVLHARAEIVNLHEGDVITFPGVKDYLHIVIA